MKKVGIIVAFALMTLSSMASHIVGGDFFVKQVGPNLYEVTLTIFRDCDPNAISLSSPSGITIFDNNTNTSIRTFNITNRVSLDTIPLGDDCFSPSICIEQNIYRDTIVLNDNVGGYYLTWDVCCRNNGVTNLNNPSGDGSTYYVQIPDPAVAGGNSSPFFGSYPRKGYFCIDRCDSIPMNIRDADGDELKYSLITPYDENNGSARPFPRVQWANGHNATDILGAGSTLTINPNTGTLYPCASTMGVYVVSILVEEFRDGVKIGESVRDLQFEAINCPPLSLSTIVSPSANIVKENDSCFDIVIGGVNGGDTLFVETDQAELQGEAVSVFVPNPVSTNPTQYRFQYEDANGITQTVTTNEIVEVGNGKYYSTDGTVGLRVCWDFKNVDCDDLYQTFEMPAFAYARNSSSANCTRSDTAYATFILEPQPEVPFSLATANVFTPNGDGKNDYYRLYNPNDPTFSEGRPDPCTDNIKIKIMNRWGQIVFEADDYSFEWDGKNSNGKAAPAGTYFVLLEGVFANKEVTDQFPVTLFR